MGKPLGKDRLIVEVLSTEVDKSVGSAAMRSLVSGEPTRAMLNEGHLIQQRVFANSQADSENVVGVGRLDDGTATAEAWEGQRFFTSIEENASGYALTFVLTESRLEGWVNFNSVVQPILDLHQMHQNLTLHADGKWTCYVGLARPAQSDTAGMSHTVQHLVYIRLLADKSSPQLPITPATDLVPLHSQLAGRR